MRGNGGTASVNLYYSYFLWLSSGKIMALHLYSVVFSSLAKYTDRSSDRRRSAKLVPTLADRGCHVVSATTPSDHNFDFLDPEPLLFLPSSSSICSWGWVDTVPEPLLLRKSGNAGNRTRDPRVSSQKLWPLDHRGGPMALHLGE
jgi:hypothetical protein